MYMIVSVVPVVPILRPTNITFGVPFLDSKFCRTIPLFFNHELTIFSISGLLYEYIITQYHIYLLITCNIYRSFSLVKCV